MWISRKEYNKLMEERRMLSHAYLKESCENARMQLERWSNIIKQSTCERTKEMYLDFMNNELTICLDTIDNFREFAGWGDVYTLFWKNTLQKYFKFDDDED